jgi:type IV pilus assembly protein PilA
MSLVLRSKTRGFTLVELMIVVVIAGILATIAGYGLSRYISSSKTGEAVQMIGSIKAAQESYKDETFQYVAVADNVTDQDSFYPHDFSASVPGRDKVQWGGGNAALSARWSELAVNPSGPVLFAYASTAGAADAALTSAGSDISIGGWPTNLGQPWYIVKARADLNSGGPYTVYVGVSFTTQIFSANEGE